MSEIEQGCEAVPFEERLLAAVRQLQIIMLCHVPPGKDEDNAMSLFRFLKSQINEAIAERDRPNEWDADPDFVDPFGGD